MLWIFLALLAPLIWAMSNQIDVYLIEKLGETDSSQNFSVGGLIIISCLVAITVLPIAAIIDPTVFAIPFIEKILLLVVGIIEGLAILLYLYALQEDDAASITAWFNSVPLINLILGFLILGEVISPSQYIGFAITLVGLIVLSVKRDEFGIIFKKRIAGLMLLASLCFSAMTVLFKFVASLDSFLAASFWQYGGLLLLGIFFFVAIPQYRKSFLLVFKKRGASFYAMNLVNETLFIGGSLVANYAALLAPIALVSLFGSFQPLFVLLIGVAITYITKRKRIVISREERYLQIAGIFLTIVGLVFII
jgi:drug/metabolite transporter (DMT)-like permease